VSQPSETLELRLTDEQIAAIRLHIARRKRLIKECGQIDLGEMNGTEDLQSVCGAIEVTNDPTRTRAMLSSRQLLL
jgi:hypothetical protein